MALGAIRHREPDPLNTPPAVSAIVMRCLAKRPEARFQSATELHAALQRALSGRSGIFDPTWPGASPMPHSRSRWQPALVQHTFAEAKLLLRDDPLSTGGNGNLGSLLVFTHKWDEVIA